MNKETLTNIYGVMMCVNTDSVNPPKTPNFTPGYIKYFTQEWNAITAKLKRYPGLKNVPLVPEDRSNEKMKRIRI